jgi:glucose-1-phosphate cytidylyltransferase
MKAVILAGGLGTRLSEETDSRPKPMVEIGGMPIIWHIMNTYSDHGIRDFVVCLGYKGYIIKEFFSNYFLHTSDVTIDLKDNSIDIHENHAEPWRITLVDTGTNTMTGGRLKRVEKYLGAEDFCMTYGDGVSNVDLTSLIQNHKERALTATVTAVKMPGRFGALNLNQDVVESFIEKPIDDSSWINGGFFVFSNGIFDYLSGDDSILENEPLAQLSREGNLGAWKHSGFWQPMDTLRDKRLLEDYWSSGNAPWVSKNGK